MIRRLPKLRGFANVNRKDYQVINVSDLNEFAAGEEVTPLSLFLKKLIRSKTMPVKLLGDGVLEKKVTVKVQKVSATAKAKVEKAGGKLIQ